MKKATGLILVILIMSLALTLTGWATPKPPATSLDEQTVQKFQGTWESLPESNGNVLILKVTGQNVNIFSTLTAAHNDAYNATRNVQHAKGLRNAAHTYSGFETTYEINEGSIAFKGRTGIMMKFWFKDGELVGTRETDPESLIHFHRGENNPIKEQN